MNTEDTTKPKHAGGRPLRFPSAEALDAACNAYFKACDERKVEIVTKEGHVLKVTKPEPYLVMGLCVALDVDRRTLLDYAQGKYDETDPEFSHIVKKAKAKVAQFAERSLYEGNNAAGPIFSLKNNFGWIDEQQVKGDNINRNTNIDIDVTDLSDEEIDAKLNRLRTQSGA